MLLDGVRVLDFTQDVAGSGITRLMTELGAEIIKIEIAPVGDPARLIPSVPDRILGEIDIPGFPFRFSAQPELPAIDAPLLGEHNAEILSRVLGYNAGKIAALNDSGVLVSRPC